MDIEAIQELGNPEQTQAFQQSSGGFYGMFGKAASPRQAEFGIRLGRGPRSIIMEYRYRWINDGYGWIWGMLVGFDVHRIWPRFSHSQL